MLVNVCECVCVCACVCVRATPEESGSTLGRILTWHPSKLPFFKCEVNTYLQERVAGTFLWVWWAGRRGCSHLHSTHSQRQKPRRSFLEKTICCYSKLLFWGLLPPTSKWLLEQSLKFHTSISLKGLLESTVFNLITILVTLRHQRSPLTNWTWVMYTCVCVVRLMV